MSDLLSKLAEEVLPHAPWEAIAPHHARGVVFLVDGVDLPHAAAAFAANRVAVVELWLADGTLRRPSDEDVGAWAAANHEFDMLVVQPWVLIQHGRGTE